jgi:RNA polymerase sigma-70 factor (ECF subfamily)
MFSDLLQKARAGDPEAYREIVENFEEELRIAIRCQMPRKLRPLYDSMDFVQAVWASVIATPAEDPISFENDRHLLGYLTGVARNKVLQEYRRRTKTQKYDLGREEPLYVPKGPGRLEPREVASPAPTPSECMQADDRLSQLVGGRKPREAEIIRLRLMGLTCEEIAARTGLHERTVRRVLDEAKQRVREQP